MKRRDLFRLLASLVAMPLVAPIASLCSRQDRPTVSGSALHPGLTKNDDIFGQDKYALSERELDIAAAAGARDHLGGGNTTLAVSNRELYSGHDMTSHPRGREDMKRMRALRREWITRARIELSKEFSSTNVASFTGEPV